MSKLHKIYLAVLIPLALVALLMAHLHSLSLVRAEEQQRATDKVLAAKDQALADLKRDRDDRDAKYLAAMAELKTAKQGIQILQPIISPQGQQAPQVITKADLPQEAQKSIPGPPETNLHVLTDEQVINAAKRELTCEKAEGDLSTCAQEKTLMQQKIDSLTAANEQWQKTGKVGPNMVIFGVTKDAAGKGYSPNLLYGRRITNSIGFIAGVQGHGDLT